MVMTIFCKIRAILEIPSALLIILQLEGKYGLQTLSHNKRKLFWNSNW